MGNSQSMDKVQHVVDEGINIYKTVIMEQEQQKHQQYSNTTHKDNNYSTPDNDDYYSQCRAAAGEEAKKRNECYAKSQEAYRNKEGEKAKQLSNQGHQHDRLMKQFNQKAADRIYSVKNEGRPANVIDLHGLYVKEASAKVENAVKRCQANGDKDLTIIVGKGLHSPDKIAKLKPAIIELVKKYQVTCQPNIPNPGCLFIEFGKGTGDLSWLDRITEKMPFNDQCVIM